MQEQTQAIDNYVVFYGRFVEDKVDGVYLEGTYYGGIGQDVTEAENIARECVATIRGGTIVPKIVGLTRGTTLVDLLSTVTARFSELEREMIEVEDILEKE